MLKSLAYYLKFSALALVALAQPVSASWLMDVGSSHISARTTGRTSRQVSGPVSSQIPAQASAYEAMVAQHASANGVPAIPAQ
jgi:hypothetical protein